MSAALVADSEVRSDADLVRSARAGDREALALLFARYEPSVRATCRRYVRGTDVADAAQETFARALDRLDTLRDPAAFGGWLHAIARNVSRDVLVGGQRVVAVPDLYDDEPCSQPTPDAVVLAAHDARDLHERLGHLAPRDAQALWLRDAVGAPVSEVASELGLTEGSARVMLTRARHRLRAAYTGLAALLGTLRVAVRERSAPNAPLLAHSWSAAMQTAAVAVLTTATVWVGGSSPSPVGTGARTSVVPAADATDEVPPAVDAVDAAPTIPQQRADDEPTIGGGSAVLEAGPVEVGTRRPDGSEPLRAEVPAGDGGEVMVEVFSGNVAGAVESPEDVVSWGRDEVEDTLGDALGGRAASAPEAGDDLVVR